MVLSQPALAQVDYVVHNARIYTVDSGQPLAQAFAVGGDRIVWVGSNEEILRLYPEAERVNAEGRTIVPGLVDAHAHLMGQGINMLRADLVETKSVAEIVTRLEDFAERLPEDAWLTGRGWDQNDWPEKTFPTRQALDAAFPDRPVWLHRIDGHAAWANTAALQKIGLEVITRMEDPEGGKILRDEKGIPTGVFVDKAMDVIERQVPVLTWAQRKRALRLALAETARLGLTGVHDAGVNLEDLELYRKAADEGWFNLRLYGMIDGLGETFEHFCKEGPLEAYRDRVTVRSIKFYIDGALGSRGAALIQAYSDDPDNQGLLFTPVEVFSDQVRRSMECGLQVNTHAIGDLGNRVVLDAYSEAMKKANNHIGRHRIEHAQVVALEDIPRFAELGIIASMQPTHATSDMTWAEDRIGSERLPGAYAWRSFLDSGVLLAFGSDFPVESVNPLLGFYAAITRQDAQGSPPEGWIPEQRLTREEALYAFTLGAAYAAFQEDELGSIAPGKFADFVVLSHDIMTIPAPEILTTKVITTFLGGERVFGSL